MERREEEFTFLSITDQSGSLLGLQGGFSVRENRKLNIPSQPFLYYCIIHWKPRLDGFASLNDWDRAQKCAIWGKISFKTLETLY